MLAISLLTASAFSKMPAVSLGNIGILRRTMAPFKTDPRNPRSNLSVPVKLSLFVILAIAAGVFASTHPPGGIAGSLDNLFLKHSEVSPSKDRETSFFPVAVWYSGGKARAPMLETITADSHRLWKEDLSKIK